MRRIPRYLPVVEACVRCNQSFSLDEQYLACFLECVMCGSTAPNALRRENIQRILKETPRLAAEIQFSMTLSGEGGKFWQTDKERVNNVLLKLARGHLHHDLSIQEGGVPTSMDVFPLAQLEPEQRNFFECP